ncbi:MAG: hypothetical protein ACR2NM_13140 [Bythopirellula sp.]
MQSPAKTTQHALARPLAYRRGISTVELIGCLAALAGGLVLGSIYLGVDVQAMAVGMLEKADIEVPEILNVKAKANPEASSDTSAEEHVTTVSPGESAAEELPTDSIVEPTVELPVEEESSAAEEPRPELTDAEELAATRKYWKQLNQTVKTEASNRSQTIADPENWQLFDYLLHRKEGHKRAVEAIEQFDLHGVDPRLVSHVQQVLSWHRAGERLFDRAAQLLTNAPAGNLTGPFAQSWQSAATQHRMEEKLIANKHASIASYLQHANKLSEASGN